MTFPPPGSRPAVVALSAGTANALASDMRDAESCSGNGGRPATGGETLRDKIQAKLSRRRAARLKLVPAEPAPRYDDVFFDGIAWLEIL